MIGVLGVYVAALLAGFTMFLAYIHVSSSKSFAISKKIESSNFHLITMIVNMAVVTVMMYVLGTFVSYGNLISLPLSLIIFGISLKNADIKTKAFKYDSVVDEPFKYDCLTNYYLGLIKPGENKRVKKFKELLNRGDKLSIFLRYALVSPSAALVATSLYPVLGPISLFAMGYSLQGPVALFSAIGGWLGLLASLKGEMGPLVRARLIEEKVRMFIKGVTFPEALVAYIAFVFVLTLLATYGFYKKIKDWGIEVVALFVPLVAYAIAQNRFGEPLAVGSFALGATLSLKFRVVDPTKILEKSAQFLKKLGAILVYYEVPLRPYIVLASLAYFTLSVRCVGLRALIDMALELKKLLRIPPAQLG